MGANERRGAGTKYYRYYLDPDYIEEYRRRNRLYRFWENVKSLFK